MTDPDSVCFRIGKCSHFVILNAVKNLEHSCLCMQVLHFVQDDITG